MGEVFWGRVVETSGKDTGGVGDVRSGCYLETLEGAYQFSMLG